MNVRSVPQSWQFQWQVASSSSSSASPRLVTFLRLLISDNPEPSSKRIWMSEGTNIHGHKHWSTDDFFQIVQTPKILGPSHSQLRVHMKIFFIPFFQFRHYKKH